MNIFVNAILEIWQGSKYTFVTFTKYFSSFYQILFLTYCQASSFILLPYLMRKIYIPNIKKKNNDLILYFLKINNRKIQSFMQNFNRAITLEAYLKSCQISIIEFFCENS